MNEKVCVYCNSNNGVHKSSVDNKHYCQKHYQQMYKYGELKIDRELTTIKYEENEKCKVEGCNSRILAKGYCSKHYNQVYTRGRVLKRTISDLNEIIEHDTYAEIILYNIKCKEIARAIIDLDDINKIKQYKWGMANYRGVKYVISRMGGDKNIILGRFLIGETEGILDYKDRDTLNNRKYNLRISNRSTNGINCGLRINNTSGFTGVVKTKNRWEARIKVMRKSIYLGTFENKKDAIKARIDGEILYFGEYSPNY